MPRCCVTTGSGNPCSRDAIKGSVKCKQHQPAKFTCGTKKQVAKEENAGCCVLTKAGTPCKRKPVAGHAMCTNHENLGAKCPTTSPKSAAAPSPKAVAAPSRGHKTPPSRRAAAILPPPPPFKSGTRKPPPPPSHPPPSFEATYPTKAAAAAAIATPRRAAPPPPPKAAAAAAASPPKTAAAAVLKGYVGLSSSKKDIQVDVSCLSKVPELRGWEIKEAIGSGFLGDVFLVCSSKSGECSRVLKIVPFVAWSDKLGYRQGNFDKEVSNLKVGLKYRLAPVLHAYWTCDNIKFTSKKRPDGTPGPYEFEATAGFFLLDRWHTTLAALAPGTLPKLVKDGFKRSVIKMVRGEKEAILNTDMMAPKKILVNFRHGTKTPLFMAFGDWGSSALSRGKLITTEAEVEEAFRVL